MGPNYDDDEIYDDPVDNNVVIPPSEAQLLIDINLTTTTTATTPGSTDQDYGEDDYPVDVLNPDDDPVTRVVGGKPARHGQFPHQVSLQRWDTPNSHFCGGAVIHPLLILTAARCLTMTGLAANQIRVITGEHRIQISDGTEQVRGVTEIFLHEGWSDSRWDNDIALLALDQPLKFDNYTQPIENWQRGVGNKTGAVVSGWGAIGDRTLYRDEELQYARIKFKDHTNCTRHYSKSKNITNNMICAGGIKDACKGDSGGPLTCRKWKNNDKEHYLCGLVSFGFDCGKGHPGVYTDVSKYHGWIKKHMRILWWKHWMTSLGKPLFGDDKCDEGTFRCENSGACIPAKLQCDGVSDCDPLAKGKYDEKDCTEIRCPPAKFLCKKSKQCIPSELVCNGKNDCPGDDDNSDEKNSNCV